MFVRNLAGKLVYISSTRRCCRCGRKVKIENLVWINGKPYGPRCTKVVLRRHY